MIAAFTSVDRGLSCVRRVCQAFIFRARSSRQTQTASESAYRQQILANVSEAPMMAARSSRALSTLARLSRCRATRRPDRGKGRALSLKGIPAHGSERVDQGACLDRLRFSLRQRSERSWSRGGPRGCVRPRVRRPTLRRTTPSIEPLRANDTRPAQRRSDCGTID